MPNWESITAVSLHTYTKGNENEQITQKDMKITPFEQPQFLSNKYDHNNPNK